jgi:hypothetical protein
MLWVAHDLAVVRHVSDRVIVMYLGQIVEMGAKAQIFLRRLIPTRRRCSRLYRCPILGFAANGSPFYCKETCQVPPIPTRLPFPHPLLEDDVDLCAEGTGTVCKDDRSRPANRLPPCRCKDLFPRTSSLT